MKAKVRITKSFAKLAKPLLKKYPSLKNELIQLEKTLEENPELGKLIGRNCRKIRVLVKSKGKGKRGGIRVISFLEGNIIAHFENIAGEVNVILLAIYDKSDTATITDKEIEALIEIIEE